MPLRRSEVPLAFVPAGAPGGTPLHLEVGSSWAPGEAPERTNTNSVPLKGGAEFATAQIYMLAK